MCQLEVIVAHSAGTCFGVEAAIDIAKKVKKPILGPLVHNPQIVGDLAAEGIPILERYDGMKVLEDNGYKEVIITAHGYPKQLKEELVEKGIEFFEVIQKNFSTTFSQETQSKMIPLLMILYEHELKFVT